MFVRFVAGTEAENAYWLTGIFTIAKVLQADGRLYRYESEMLEETFKWFNRHLPCPPFGEKLRSGEWAEEAVAWFRDDAGEPLKRMWELVAILEEHGTPVRLVRSERPGKIVYSDRFQIVAETPYWV
jgi:hypothetical protein